MGGVANSSNNGRYTAASFGAGSAGIVILYRRAKAQLAGKSDEPALDEFHRLLEADVMCFRHRKEIERGDLGFLDKCLEY